MNDAKTALNESDYLVIQRSEKRCFSLELIELRNFMTFRYGLFYPLGEINLICGPNGSGKSTLVSALATVFYDPLKLGRHQNKSLLIKNGEKKAEIRIGLTIDGDTEDNKKGCFFKVIKKTLKFVDNDQVRTKLYISTDETCIVERNKKYPLKSFKSVKDFASMLNIEEPSKLVGMLQIKNNEFFEKLNIYRPTSLNFLGQIQVSRFSNFSQSELYLEFIKTVDPDQNLEKERERLKKLSNEFKYRLVMRQNLKSEYSKYKKLYMEAERNLANKENFIYNRLVKQVASVQTRLENLKNLNADLENTKKECLELESVINKQTEIIYETKKKKVALIELRNELSNQNGSKTLEFISKFENLNSLFQRFNATTLERFRHIKISSIRRHRIKNEFEILKHEHSEHISVLQSKYNDEIFNSRFQDLHVEEENRNKILEENRILYEQTQREIAEPRRKLRLEKFRLLNYLKENPNPKETTFNNLIKNIERLKGLEYSLKAIKNKNSLSGPLLCEVNSPNHYISKVVEMLLPNRDHYKIICWDESAYDEFKDQNRKRWKLPLQVFRFDKKLFEKRKKFVASLNLKLFDGFLLDCLELDPRLKIYFSIVYNFDLVPYNAHPKQNFDFTKIKKSLGNNFEKINTFVWGNKIFRVKMSRIDRKMSVLSQVNIDLLEIRLEPILVGQNKEKERQETIMRLQKINHELEAFENKEKEISDKIRQVAEKLRKVEIRLEEMNSFKQEKELILSQIKSKKKMIDDYNSELQDKSSEYKGHDFCRGLISECIKFFDLFDKINTLPNETIYNMIFNYAKFEYLKELIAKTSFEKDERELKILQDDHIYRKKQQEFKMEELFKKKLSLKDFYSRFISFIDKIRSTFFSQKANLIQHFSSTIHTEKLRTYLQCENDDLDVENLEAKNHLSASFKHCPTSGPLMPKVYNTGNLDDGNDLEGAEVSQFELDSLVKTLTNYEARLRSIKDLLEIPENDPTKLEKDLTIQVSKWKVRITELMEKVNKLLKTYFYEAKLNGELVLKFSPKNENDPHGLAQPELSIRVAFPQDDTFHTLSGKRHSGGERSLVTVLFLTSLQAIAPFPFNVFDEVNQGMDKENEKHCLDVLFNVNKKNHIHSRKISQILVFTPTLLYEYQIPKHIFVHMIFNSKSITEIAFNNVFRAQTHKSNTFVEDGGKFRFTEEDAEITSS